MMMFNHRGTYDHIRCPVCGISWFAPIPERAHGADCPRDVYRPPVRCNPAGEDVTHSPERWGFADQLFPAPEVAVSSVVPVAVHAGSLALIYRSP